MRGTHGHDAEEEAIVGTRCTNCDAPLSGRWCSQCGQKWSPLDPTWHDVFHETIHEFLHLDGKIVCTLRLLFLKPGELTAEYFRGRRARYIGPLRLYLTTSLLFFVLASVIPNANFTPASSSPKHGHSESSPSTGTGILSRIKAGSRVADLNSEHFDEALAHTFPRAMFALVPVFAALLHLAYRNRNRHYPAFLYFSLHIHSVGFGFLLFTLPLQSFASDTWITLAQGVVLLVCFVYLVKALKHVFGGRTSAALMRAFAVTSAYLVVFAAAVGAVIAFLFYQLGQPASH